MQKLIITQAKVFDTNQSGKCYYSNEHILIKMPEPKRKDYYLYHDNFNESHKHMARKHPLICIISCLLCLFKRK